MCTATQKASIGMYSGCDLLSLQISFVYILALPSLLHPFVLFNCFLYLYYYDCNFYCVNVPVEKKIVSQSRHPFSSSAALLQLSHPFSKVRADSGASQSSTGSSTHSQVMWPSVWSCDCHVMYRYTDRGWGGGGGWYWWWSGHAEENCSERWL